MSLALKTLLFASLTILAASVPLKNLRPPSDHLLETYKNITAEFMDLRRMAGLSEKNRLEVNSHIEQQYSKELADLKDVDEANLDELVRAIEHMKMISSFIEEQVEWRKKNYATLIWQALQRVNNWKGYLPEKVLKPGYPQHVGNVTSKTYY